MSSRKGKEEVQLLDVHTKKHTRNCKIKGLYERRKKDDGKREISKE